MLDELLSLSTVTTLSTFPNSFQHNHNPLTPATLCFSISSTCPRWTTLRFTSRAKHLTLTFHSKLPLLLLPYRILMVYIYYSYVLSYISVTVFMYFCLGILRNATQQNNNRLRAQDICRSFKLISCLGDQWNFMDITHTQGGVTASSSSSSSTSTIAIC